MSLIITLGVKLVQDQCCLHGQCSAVHFKAMLQQAVSGGLQKDKIDIHCIRTVCMYDL